MAKEQYCLHKNVTWYHRPKDGKLSKKHFERLKSALLAQFRFWLRGVKTQVYWSLKNKAVAVKFRKGMMGYPEIKDQISAYIHGYYKALEPLD